MTEIELKAHIDNPDSIEAALMALPGTRKTGQTVKNDVYLGLAGSPVRVRLRDENGTHTLTYKRKEVRSDIEVNDEKETEVSNREAVHTLLADIGFEPFLNKTKQTRSFSVPYGTDTTVTAEISLVEPLGWFLELEILLECTDPDEASVSKARETLLAVLASCGVEQSAIENRYYSEMLG